VGKRRGDSFRERIEIRAAWRCEYCRAPQSACGYRFHLEHVTPSAEGGSDDVENRALACAACNLAKSDRMTGMDPQTKRLVPLFNPRCQLWNDHFRWANDRQTIVGLTPEGRATARVLKLNEEMRLEARTIWFEVGLLP
jgi:hypothetical protein